jgi:hypothetical protein
MQPPHFKSVVFFTLIKLSALMRYRYTPLDNPEPLNVTV